MKQLLNSFILSLLLLIFSATYLFSQNKNSIASGRTNWKTNPFEQKVFIENRGQFAVEENIKANTIKYAIANEGVEIFFMPQGLAFKHVEFKRMSSEELEEKEKTKEGRRDDEMQKPIHQYVYMNWLGANAGAEIVADEEVSYYFSYLDTKDLSGKSSLKAKAYKKITYKNLYPGIDVEYIFPENKSGIEYSFILHPGADVSNIKMKYSKIENTQLDAVGNINIETAFGQLIDHAPITFYKGGATIKSDFELNENIISFHLDNSYDHSQTVIIDPWITIPTFTGFTGFNSAYDVDYDLQGNVYIYGGSEPFQEMKFNSSGVIQWIFTHPTVSPYWFGQFYGDFAVDHISGSSYIAQGVGSAGATKVAKLNSAGGVVSYFMGAPDMDEIWRIVINNCTHQAIIGTANHNASDPAQAAMLDTNVTSMTFVNVLSAPGSGNDPCLLAIDNSNNCFMDIAKSLTGGTFDNMLLRFPANTFFPTAWIVPDGYSFKELVSVTYVNNQYQGANGFNGMAVNDNFLYTYDGATLKKWDKVSGALLANVSVTFSPFNWGGLDVDECDNIYVGGPSWVKHYDVNLALVNTIPVTADVYDLKLGPMNKLYVCGDGFVSEILITSSICNVITLTTTATSTPCSASTGTATVTATGGTPPYTYLWSPSAGGQTTQTATGLSPGTYFVTVIDNACTPRMQKDTVVVTSIGGFTVTGTQSDISCNGGSNGSGTAIVTGGTLPYTYNWSPGGGTNANVSGLSLGSYTVTVTDSTGCVQQLTVTIAQPAPLTSSVTSISATCGNPNGSATVISSGGTSPYAYSWNPSGQTSDNATGLGAGSYTVTVTDSSSCTVYDTVAVSSTGSITATAGPDSTICSGQNVTISSSGGSNYSWSNGETTASITISPNDTTIYSVIVSNGSCMDTAFVTIIVNPSPTVSVSGNTTLCNGDNTTLTASGGTNYTWNNGNTTSIINVSPDTTETYSVTASIGSCISTTSIEVVVAQVPLASVAGTIICSGQSATLTASGGGNYLWSNGTTNSAITISPTVTTTYTVIVSVGSCSDTTNAIVTVNPMPLVALGNDQTICDEQNVTLDAGNSNASYLWSTGETSQTINVSAAGNYWVIIALNNCLAKDTIETFIVPKIHLSDSSLCTTSPILLNPGSGASGYLWSTGSTSQSIYVDVAGDYWVVANYGNCLSGDTSKITGDGSGGLLFIPNTFTPDNDNLNEIFLAKGTGIASFKMSVFDRWGNLIFESDDVNNGWNGKIQGGHYPLQGDGKEVAQEDVYVWKIEYTTQCFPDQVKKAMGHVSIVK